MTTFGAYIRACRHKAGKSQREVAESIGVSYAYVQQVETGVRGPFVRERWPALVTTIGADLAELERLAVPEVERLREENAELRRAIDRVSSTIANVTLR